MSDGIDINTFNYVHSTKRTVQEYNEKLFPRALHYLSNKYGKASEMGAFFHDPFGQSAFYFVAKHQSTSIGEKNYTTYEKANFDKLLVKLITHFSEIKNDLDFTKQQTNIANAVLSEDIGMRQTLTLRYTLFLLGIIANENPKFCNNFCVHNGLKALLVMLNDSEFVNRNQATVLVMWADAEELLIDNLVWNLAEVSAYAKNARQYWTKFEAENIIHAMRNKLSARTFHCIEAVMSDEVEQSTFNYDHGARSVNKLLFPKALHLLANKYTNASEDNSDIIGFFQDTLGQKALYFVANYQSGDVREDDYPKYEKYGIEKILAKMINYFCEVRNNLDFSKQEINIGHIFEPSTDLETRQTLALRFTLYLIRSVVANVNPPLSNSFCTYNGLRALLTMLSDAHFVNKNQTTEIIMFGETRKPLLDYLVRGLTELSAYCEDVKQYWRKMEAVAIINAMRVRLPECSFPCLTAITNLADDAQIERLEEVYAFRSMLVERLQSIAGQCDAVSTQMTWCTIFENKSRIAAQFVYYTEPNGGETTLHDILQCLYRLAINYKMKAELYFDLHCKKYIKSILSAAEPARLQHEPKYILK
jgi:hypothetical protein